MRDRPPNLSASWMHRNGKTGALPFSISTPSEVGCTQSPCRRSSPSDPRVSASPFEIPLLAIILSLPSSRPYTPVHGIYHAETVHPALRCKGSGTSPDWEWRPMEHNQFDVCFEVRSHQHSMIEESWIPLTDKVTPRVTCLSKLFKSYLNHKLKGSCKGRDLFCFYVGINSFKGACRRSFLVPCIS